MLRSFERGAFKIYQDEVRNNGAESKASEAGVNTLPFIPRCKRGKRDIHAAGLPVAVGLALTLVSCGAISTNRSDTGARGISFSPVAHVSSHLVHFVSPKSKSKTILIYSSNGRRPSSIVFAANGCANTAGFFPAYEPSSSAASPPFASVTVEPISVGKCTALLENQDQQNGSTVTIAVQVGAGKANRSQPRK